MRLEGLNNLKLYLTTALGRKLSKQEGWDLDVLGGGKVYNMGKFQVHHLPGTICSYEVIGRKNVFVLKLR